MSHKENHHQVWSRDIFIWVYTECVFLGPLENHTETYMTYGRSFNRLLGIPHIHAPFFLKKAASRPIQFKWYAFGHDLQHIPQPTFHIHSCCCCFLQSEERLIDLHRSMHLHLPVLTSPPTQASRLQGEGTKQTNYH